MTSLSQSFAKLRSPAVLIAHNGSALAIPNYMADEIEVSRASIVAAICSGSPLAGPSRMQSQNNTPTVPLLEANGSGAGRVVAGGSSDSGNENGDEGNASNPVHVEPFAYRSRCRMTASPTQGQRSSASACILSPGDLTAVQPSRPASANPPTLPSPRMGTPLVSFSDGSPRRQMTPTSDVIILRNGSPVGAGAATITSGSSSFYRRTLSASTTAQAHAPLSTAPMNTAEQDLVAAVTGRVVQKLEYDDDSFDEDELTLDLEAAQNTLARALEMARTGTTVVAAVKVSNGSPQSPKRFSEAVSVSNGRTSVGHTGAGSRSGNLGQVRVRPEDMEVEITPAATPVSVIPQMQLQPHQQQQLPTSLERAFGTTGNDSLVIATGAVASSTCSGGVSSMGRASESISAGCFDQTCQLNATTGLGRRGSGSAADRSGNKHPWSPRSASSSVPSPSSSLRVHSSASVPQDSSILAASFAVSTVAATGSQAPVHGSGGFGQPLRQGVHIEGSDMVSGDVEIGGGRIGAAATAAISAGKGVGVGVGNLIPDKDAAGRLVQASAGNASSVAGGGSPDNRGTGIHGLRGLFKLAKKAFRRSIVGRSGRSADAQLPSPSPLALSEPGEQTGVNFVSAPRTPPAKGGVFPELPSLECSKFETAEAAAIAMAAGAGGITTAAGQVWTTSADRSGVASGRQLPSSPVLSLSLVEAARAMTVTASNAPQVTFALPYARSMTVSTEGKPIATRASPSHAPPSAPSLLRALGQLPLDDSQMTSSPHVHSWLEGDGSIKSSSTGGSSGGGSVDTTISPLSPTLAQCSGEADRGANGTGALATWRRSGAASAGGGGHIAVSKLQVTAHVQSFMHYQQQQQQEQHQAQQGISSSFSAGDTASGRVGGLRRPGSVINQSSTTAATAVAEQMDSGRSGANNTCQSAEEHVSVEKEILPAGDNRSIEADTAVASAKMPLNRPDTEPSDAPSGGGGWRPVLALPPLPPRPANIKTTLSSTPNAAVSCAPGASSPRWSPRSPASPSCHMGSPLGPYYQQPLQQRRSYSLSSQPTSPRASFQGYVGPPTPPSDEEQIATAAGTVPRPGPNTCQAGAYRSQTSQEPVRNSRTSPTITSGTAGVAASLLPGAADNFDVVGHPAALLRAAGWTA